VRDPGARVARAAPVYPFLSDYKRVWKIDQDAGAYVELKDYFRRFDPRHEREDDVWTRLGYVDVQYLAPRIKAQVMLAVGLRDTVCPPSTQFAACNKITSPKSTVLYPDFGHETLPGHSDATFQFMAGL
jgi:cephalosporin-C deacetylase